MFFAFHSFGTWVNIDASGGPFPGAEDQAVARAADAEDDCLASGQG